MMRKIAQVIFNKFGILVFYTLKKTGYLKNKGWFVSYKSKKSVDLNGIEIPWLSYPFMDFITPRLKQEFEIFEYGSGGSSLWFQGRLKTVVSCEHNKDWYTIISQKAGENLHLLYREVAENAYSNAILENDMLYDIILIDGVDRVNCSKNAPKMLKPGGIIVWDDSDRTEYFEGQQHLTEMGFKRIDFYGMRPVSDWSSCTTIFYRTENCLGI